MLIVIGGGLFLVGSYYVLTLTYVILTTKSGIYTQFPYRQWLELAILALALIVFYLAVSWFGPLASGARDSDTSAARVVDFDNLDTIRWLAVEFSTFVLCAGPVRVRAGSQWSDTSVSCTGAPTRHVAFRFPQSLEPGEYINELRVFEDGRIIGLDGRAADLTFRRVRVPGR